MEAWEKGRIVVSGLERMKADRKTKYDFELGPGQVLSGIRGCQHANNTYICHLFMRQFSRHITEALCLDPHYWHLRNVDPIVI